MTSSISSQPNSSSYPPSTAPTTAPTMTSAAPTTSTTTSSAPSDFAFPPQYSFPPFFTLQPVLSTRTSQLQSWSTLIQSYCRHHRLFSLTLVDALPTPLFTNAALSRHLALRDARSVVHWMTTPEGGNRAEWIVAAGKRKGGAAADELLQQEGGKAWIYWRRPEEWAAAIEEWVERTGQKGTVLTLYEIAEGDASRREEFYGIDAELLQKSLAVSVKRGKAQVFGSEGSEGVKFF